MVASVLCLRGAGVAVWCSGLFAGIRSMSSCFKRCPCAGRHLLCLRRWRDCRAFALASALCLRASSVAPVRGGTYFSLPPQRKVGAVSKAKCNSGVDRNILFCAFFHKDFSRSLPAERLAPADVHPHRDQVELALREHGQVCAFGQVLAQKTIGVLADTALPGAVRIAEVDTNACGLGKLLKFCHFLALVVRQGL